jgi:hypothetical protein
MEKIKIDGIVDSDLAKVLEEFDLYSMLKEGKLACSVCNKLLVWDNIGAIMADGEELKIVCNEIECIENLQK